MNLRNGITTAIMTATLLTSCQDKVKNTSEANREDLVENEAPQTYAEIGVKQGGEWKEAKYSGGSFENVQEVQLPPEHTDHSNYIRYEGPGWENGQVAYRLYLDWRNAIDIFGKKVDTMVLAQVGLENSPSYHDEAPWGLDILKAGQSLGLGGFGRYNGDEVLHFEEVENTTAKVINSEDSSGIEIAYTGWVTEEDTTDLNARLSIFPEDRFTKVTLESSEPIENLATGLVKFDDLELISEKSPNGDWGYIATYGKQTLVNDEDQLGMAIFYRTDEVKETLTGPHDHLVVFKAQKPLTYYFLAAWEQEKNGITSKQAFLADLDSKLQQLEEKGQLEE